jgi:hypothetical protein
MPFFNLSTRLNGFWAALIPHPARAVMQAHPSLLVVIVCTLSLIAVDVRGQTLRDLFDSIEDLGKTMELQKFCAKNPGHTRCKEMEERQAFCNSYPTHDRCKEDSASTVLFRCESTDPYVLGMCHGSLMAYAEDGAKNLIEWKCVPREVLRDTEQLRRLFLREAQQSPEVLHLPARQLVYYAVAKAFPCRFRAR